VRCLLATLHADVNSFDFSASTLRDFIEFENIELSFAADITFFPHTDVAVNWTPSFEAEFDPENVFRVLKQQVIDQAEDYMSVSACVLACLLRCKKGQTLSLRCLLGQAVRAQLSHLHGVLCCCASQNVIDLQIMLCEITAENAEDRAACASSEAEQDTGRRR
jgi:hypothetical protein